ncbi:MAG: filamentous hemagglutinin N-terminal domain-containing protein [Coleofasciculus sp. D1-CHI-01]|uniref:two-partner secretion domain-containing protein n=1 Tax=Coleofasciculus sp. D1-CHI-01 TaxID=3068482 RepID=UPI0032F9528F
MMTQTWKRWWWTWAGIVGIGGVFAFWDTAAVAQITPDTTLGTENSVVTPNVDIQGLPADLIEGGATRNAALFHSFSEFNVGEGLRVYFANPVGIETIFSRVTGSDVSDILGTLGVKGGASLFLLNPNGIIFGENARLDIAGSFVASTANSVVFENGVEFSATNPEAPPLLTINLTPGLQYGSNSNGKIANAGTLEVGVGETLSLYGNTVTNTGILTAPGGTVQVLGDRVGLFDNTQIDVSSDMGGGTVLIGVAEEANNLYIPSVTHATRTFVSPDTVINANGIGNSDGGNVFVWSDEVTRFYGTISARGGEMSGHGGFVEVSGQQYLDFNGQVDAIAPNGVVGTLLLDPTNIEVVAGFGETIDLNQVDAFDDPDIGGDGDTKLSAFALNFATANISLQATNDIIVNASIFNLTPDVGIRLEAGNNILLNQSITTTAGFVELVAGNDISITSFGSGIFTDGAGVDLNAGGTIALSNGAVIDTSALVFGVNSGDINIQTDSLLMTNGAQIIGNNAFGVGNPGNISVQANDAISLSEASGILSSVPTGVTGNGGLIELNARSLSLTDGSQVQTLLFREQVGVAGGQGKAGTIQITATDFIEVIDSSLEASNLGTQPGGDITITAKQLTFQNGGAFTSNLSEGNAGNLTIQDAEFVHLNKNSVLSTRVNEMATGNGGALTIDTGRLIVEDNSGILTSTSGVGHAGDLTINATDLIQVSQESILSAQVNETATGNGGNLTIDTGRLMLQDSGFISIGTFGQGRGGTLRINASESVDVIGGIEGSGIFAGTLGFKPAGDLIITTRQLFVGNNAAITTTTSGMGDAGNLTIHAWDSVDINGRGRINTNVREGGQGMGGDLFLETGQLTVQNGGQISAGTFDQGNAGTLTIQATDTVRLTGRSQDGNPSGLFTQSQGEGAAGGLRVITQDLIVQDGAAVSVSGFGSGNPGNLDIEAQSIFLDQGRIEAGTTSGVGANIALQVQDNILMRNRSLINAQALNNGSGGNLDINADFVIAIPVENSDIIANAQEGSGGRIDITAQRIFGLQVRDPLTPLSDINASSEFGTDGEVVINQPDVDPNRGLLQLPTGLVDPTRLIDRSCNAGGAALASSFIFTGRGGIPPSPLDVLESDVMVSNWVTLDEETPTQTQPETVTSNSNQPRQIIEAQGWVKLADGQIILVAESPTVTPQMNWQNTTGCESPESK